MEGVNPVDNMREAVQNLTVLALRLYESSGEFPAVNRNSKRILASLEMLRINLEEA
jgi:hypothetical protein